jgi:leucyl/phenylalanyl-tRNA--protein transferase
MEFELTPDIILRAYRAGIFPMAPNRHSPEINWYEPEQRGVLPIAGLHVPKKLRRTIKQRPYQVTFDRAFEAVMRGCADARPDTWINDEIIALYTALHRQGHAHSVEAWQGGNLVGGVYGISIGGAFFGESMFSTATDASKIALVYLVARLWRQGFELLDAQFINEHLKQFGIFEIPRGEYQRRLKKALAKKVSFSPLPLGEGQGEGTTDSAICTKYPHPGLLPEGEGVHSLPCSFAGVGAGTALGSGVSSSSGDGISSEGLTPSRALAGAVTAPGSGAFAGGATSGGAVSGGAVAGDASSVLAGVGLAAGAGVSEAGLAAAGGVAAAGVSEAGLSEAGLSDAGAGVAAVGSAGPLTGAPSGAFSVENSCDFEAVVAFLHSITQTS